MEIEQIEPIGSNHICELCNTVKAITYVTHNGKKTFMCRSCWESTMASNRYKEL